LALSPGASGSTTLTVASPSTATAGTYGVGVATSSSAGSVHGASAGATYAVMASGSGITEALGTDKTSRGLRFSSTRNIVCPWHGYEFNIETGCHPGDPSVRLEPIDVAVRDSRIYLRVPDPVE